jgi:hypothetical protein
MKGMKMDTKTEDVSLQLVLAVFYAGALSTLVGAAILWGPGGLLLATGLCTLLYLILGLWVKINKLELK